MGRLRIIAMNSWRIVGVLSTSEHKRGMQRELHDDALIELELELGKRGLVDDIDVSQKLTPPLV